jgi:hypothetical protein
MLTALYLHLTQAYRVLSDLYLHLQVRVKLGLMGKANFICVIHLLISFCLLLKSFFINLLVLIGTLNLRRGVIAATTGLRAPSGLMKIVYVSVSN